MTIFKGDRVTRVDGTANGFRRNETFEAVDVSRTHIKVKNDAGLISKWFERKDFMLLNEVVRRKQMWVTLYKDRGGVVHQVVDNSVREANANVGFIQRQAGYVLLAKKKITIPYQEAGL